MWLVYFILTLDSVTFAATLFAVFAGIGWLVTFIMSCVATAQQNSNYPDFDEDDKKVIDKIKNEGNPKYNWDSKPLIFTDEGKTMVALKSNDGNYTIIPHESYMQIKKIVKENL